MSERKRKLNVDLIIFLFLIRDSCYSSTEICTKKNTQKLNYSPCEIDQTHFGIYMLMFVYGSAFFFCASFFLVEKNKIHTVEIFEHFYACVKLIEPKYAQL